MPKIINKKEKCNEIVLAFEDCMEEKPLLSITMRDIAAKAHMTHPTVMKYFPDKSDLIKHYIEKVTDDYFLLLRWKFNSILEKPKSVNDILKMLVESMYNVDGTLNCNDKFLQMYVAGQFDPKIKEAVKYFHSEMQTFILEKLSCKEPSPEDKILANSVTTILEGIFTMSLTNDMDLKEALIVCSKIQIEF